MDTEARAFVKKLLEEGQRYDDVRRALISHGHSTKGFEKEYPEIQKELGIKEPPPTKVSPHATNVLDMGIIKGNAEYHSHRKSKLIANVVKLIVGLFIIAVAVILLSGYGTTLKNMIFESESIDMEEGFMPTDITHQTQLKSMQLTAKTYKSKLTDYQGVCKSIGLDTSIYTCKENIESYVMEAPLSNGSYYCVDSTGFSGITREPSSGDVLCAQ